MKHTISSSRVRAKSKRWMLIPVIVLGLIAMAEGATLAGENSPEYSRTTSPSTSSLKLRYELASGRCDSCHTQTGSMAHPVEVVPSMETPSWLPLSDNKMTCTTCHVEADVLTHENAMGSHDPLLRTGLSPQAMCVSCHDASFSSPSEAHATSMGWAHSPTQAVHSEFRGYDSDRLIDAQSSRCLSCHDGSYASDVSSGSNNFSSDSHMTDHPIGISMKHPGSYSIPLASADTLDNRIQLYNDSIGCGTCHNLYSPIPNNLVMSNYKSQLCLSCHLY